MNNLHKTILCVTLAIAAANDVCGSVSTGATFDEKVDNASAIILGRCIRHESRWTPERRWIVTYSTFAVQKSLKGLVGSEVVVVLPGGTVDGITQVTSGIPVLPVGNEYVLFLRNTRLGLSVLYFDQGVYAVRKDSGGEREVICVPINIVHLDGSKAAISSDQTKTLSQFEQDVATSLAGVAQRMQMSAMQSKSKPLKRNVFTVLAENKGLAILTMLALAFSFWLIHRR
jgi:hypothetical protein